MSASFAWSTSMPTHPLQKSSRGPTSRSATRSRASPSRSAKRKVENHEIAPRQHEVHEGLFPEEMVFVSFVNAKIRAHEPNAPSDRPCPARCRRHVASVRTDAEQGGAGTRRALSPERHERRRTQEVLG